MALAAVALHVAVALRVRVVAAPAPKAPSSAAASSSPHGDYLQNLRQAAYMRAWRQVARSVAVPAWVLATR